MARVSPEIELILAAYSSLRTVIDSSKRHDCDDLVSGLTRHLASLLGEDTGELHDAFDDSRCLPDALCETTRYWLPVVPKVKSGVEEPPSKKSRSG